MHSVETVEDGFDYLVIRQPPVKIPAGVTLDEIGDGQGFVLYHIKNYH